MSKCVDTVMNNRYPFEITGKDCIVSRRRAGPEGGRRRGRGNRQQVGAAGDVIEGLDRFLLNGSAIDGAFTDAGGIQAEDDLGVGL